MKKRLAVLTLALSAAMMLSFGAFAEEEEHEYPSETPVVTHHASECEGDLIEVTKEPTCTEQGLATYTCKYVEGQFHYEVIEPTGHTWSSNVDGENWGRITTEPTCQQEGYAEDYCKVCGAVNNDINPRVIEKTDHRFESYVVDNIATCKEDGHAHWECIYCGTPMVYEEGEHKGEIIYDITPAYDEYHYEHPELWTSWAQDIAPTCWKEGREWRGCTLCQDKEYRTVPALEPNYVEISQRLVDCYTREITYQCSLCEGKEDKNHVVAHENYTVPYPVKSHVFKLEDKYLLDSEIPKCDAKKDGYKLYGCVFYDDNHVGDDTATMKITVPIPDHKWGKWIQHYAPSEASDGYGTWAHKCSVCGLIEEKLSKTDPNNTTPEAGEKDKKNGFVKDEDGKVRLYKEDEVRTDVSGVVSYNDGFFFITEGVIDSDADGLNLFEGTWYFLADGQVQNQYSGFAEYDNNWFMIENGMLNEDANGLYEYNGGTFMFAAGKLRTDYSGLWQNTDGKWYYLANGQVQTQHTGVVQYDGAFFYVVKGQLATDYNGTVDYDGKTFKVVAGQLY